MMSQIQSLFIGDVAAGFPSPAESYAEDPLDLNQLLIRRPAATFFVRASGDSMQDAGIHDGDLLIVDRSVTARDGHVVIASINGDFTVKYLRTGADQARYLVPANPRYHPIRLTEAMDVDMFGVVTAVIHRY